MSASPLAPREIDNTYREDGQPLRRFWLRRLKDETGISRTGRVLEGVVTQSGRVLVEWRPPHSTLGVYKDLEEFRIIHVDCHPSCNEIVWLDDDSPTAAPRDAENEQHEILASAAIEAQQQGFERLCFTCLQGFHGATCPRCAGLTTGIIGHACLSGPQCPICGDHAVDSSVDATRAPREAPALPIWTCPHCATTQFGGNKVCSVCAVVRSTPPETLESVAEWLDSFDWWNESTKGIARKILERFGAASPGAGGLTVEELESLLRDSGFNVDAHAVAAWLLPRLVAGGPPSES